MSEPEFEIKLTLNSGNELITRTGAIAGLLETAARILRNHDTDRLDSVTWRVADASMLLQDLIADPKSGWSKDKHIGGIHRPTGLGAMLGDGVDDGGILGKRAAQRRARWATPPAPSQPGHPVPKGRVAPKPLKTQLMRSVMEGAITSGQKETRSRAPG